jgi:plastocyanin
MRFSAITAMCAAPLALAGTLQADLFARGAVGSEVGLSVDTEIGSSGNSKSSSNSNSKSSNNNGGNNVIIQEDTTINEVIIIWVNNGGGQATTTVTSTTTVAGAAAVIATHTVVVGGTAGLVYTPDTIEAAVGDMVIFTFESQNHTATQSAFTTPCEKLTGGMDSGFMPNLNNSVTPPPQMAMQVTVATPIWFYCRQSGHCGKGMTFSINPTANKTQAMFQQMAIAQNGTGTTAVIAGGTASTTLSTTATTFAAAATSTSVNSGTMVSGSGTINTGGACECSCLCGVAAFPNAAVQGIGAFGGLPGAMPMSALET